MSDFSIFELLLIQFILIFLNAIFACAEIAVISLNNIKLNKMAESGNKKASRLLYLTKHPSTFLATIQIGITLAGFLGSAFAADNFSDRIVAWLISCGVTISPSKLDVISVVGITLVLSYVTLILGELVPKRIAMKYSEQIALSISWLIYIIAKIFAPFVAFLTFSTNIVLKLFKIDPEEENEKITEEEIRIMIDAGSEIGAVKNIEKEMLHNIFEFDDKQIQDIMTHRVDVTFLNIDDRPNWYQIMIKSRYSTYPVYQKNYDNIIGFISLKDYLRYQDAENETFIKNALIPPQFFIETMHIDALFLKMQQSRKHFAAVVDEYGSVKGIVTMNDLLEEIVGDLEDDFFCPPREKEISQINKSTWKIKGYTPLSQVEQELGIKFPKDDYDTFAGFLFSLMKEIPSKINNTKLEYENLKIKIINCKRRKIEDTLVKIRPEQKKK